MCIHNHLEFPFFEQKQNGAKWNTYCSIYIIAQWTHKVHLGWEILDFFWTISSVFVRTKIFWNTWYHNTKSGRHQDRLQWHQSWLRRQTDGQCNEKELTSAASWWEGSSWCKAAKCPAGFFLLPSLSQWLPSSLSIPPTDQSHSESSSGLPFLFCRSLNKFLNH